MAVQQMVAEAEQDSKVADMNRILAFRTLKQTSIDNAGDLRFLVQLYLRQGRGEEALQYFEVLRPQESAVAKQASSDWQFARQRIELCVSEGKWEELRELCHSLLGANKTGSADSTTEHDLKVRDDWKVWSGLVQALEKLGKLDEFQTYQTDPAGSWKEKRQQMIAGIWVALLSAQKHAEGENTDRTFTKTVELVKEYFAVWQTYPFCYDDIKDFVVQLPLAAQTEFRQHTAQSPQKLSKLEVAEGDEGQVKKHAEWLTAEINALKFEYLLGIGIVTSLDADTIGAFSCNAIRLMDLSRRSKQRTADACYLAVAALIRLYEVGRDITALFQAAYLLESGPALEDAHPGKVMLVYVESVIGLHSLAMKQYKGLRIREIQYETMCHMLLSRVSIAHPFAVEQKRQETIDPSRIIDEGLDVFLTSDQKLANSQVKLFEGGKCDLIFELQDLRNTLTHSMSRRMLILEQARIARLTDDVPEPRVDEIRPRVMEHWTENLKDSRDYSETFNYDGVTKDRFPERRLQAGGKIPKKKWLATAILAEDVWSLLSNRATVCVTPSVPIEVCESDSEGLTAMELALVAPWNALLQVTQSLLSTEKDASLPDGIAKLKDTLSSLPLTMLSSHKSVAGLPASTKHLQNHFLLLDYLRTTALFTTVATQIAFKKRTGQVVPSTQLAALKESIKKCYDVVRKSAEGVKKGIDARDMVQAMRRGSVGDAISEAEHLDKGLRMFADRAETSARDAWEGVLRVRLGLS